jgi:hypothetical protein
VGRGLAAAGHLDQGGADVPAIAKRARLLSAPGVVDRRAGRATVDTAPLIAVGIQEVHGRVVGVERITPLELLGERVIPAVADL